MNMLRIALAALAGGVIMLVWGAVAHVASPLGQAGMASLPAAALPALEEHLDERKAYFFPGAPEHAPDAPEEEREAALAAWEAAYEAGPRGLVVYDPGGGTPFDPAQLGMEFLGGLLAAAILAVVLSRLGAGLTGGAAAGAGLGVFAWASVDVSHWVWYRFPDAMTLAALIEQGVGWLLVGAAMGLILRPRPRRAKAAE